MSGRTAALILVPVAAVFVTAAIALSGSAADIERDIIISTPAPTLTPGVPDDSNEDIHGDEDHDHEDAIDLSVETSTVQNFIVQFIEYSTEESAEARRERLRDLVGDRSELTEPPALAREDLAQYVDYSSRVTVESVDAIAWTETTADNEQWFTVFVTYRGHYTIPGQEMNVTDRREWRVLVDSDSPTVVVQVMEPSPL